MKVLIIDDAAEIRLIARIGLVRRGGHALVEAATGGEGITKAAQERPDVVLLDLNLPDMDGLDVLSALKRQPDTAGIPVVVLSATLPPLALLAERGAHGALLKPFDVGALSRDLLAQVAGAPLSAATP